MAFSKNPTDWIDGICTADTQTTLKMDMDNFPELTADEVEGSGKDIRRVLFALIDALADTWYATPDADRPTQMQIYRSPQIDAQTGRVTRNYTFQFTTSIGSEEVEDEPT